MFLSRDHNFFFLFGMKILLTVINLFCKCFTVLVITLYDKVNSTLDIVYRKHQPGNHLQCLEESWRRI